MNTGIHTSDAHKMRVDESDVIQVAPFTGAAVTRSQAVRLQIDTSESTCQPECHTIVAAGPQPECYGARQENLQVEPKDSG
jgi:hypothetical protein